MTEEEVRMFALNNGVNASPMGTPLRILDPSELPASVRAFVNDDGTYKGDNTPEAEDPKATKRGEDEGEEGEEEKQLKGKLPADFPGHAALEAEGITTYAQLRKAGDVTEVPGIGAATAAKIAEALEQ